MTPIEKAARAIYAELEGPVANQDYGRQVRLWDQSKVLAVAAIRAIREPTPSMREAILRELSDCTVIEPKAAAWDAIRAWKACIDSILSEEEAKP